MRISYVIDFLAVAAVPLLMAGYGAHLATSVFDPTQRRRALLIVWTLATVGVLLSGAQQVFAYRSGKEEEVRRAALAARDERDRQQLQAELTSSLQHEDYLRTELDAIAHFLRAPHPGMDVKGVNVVASQMAEHAMHH